MSPIKITVAAICCSFFAFTSCKKSPAGPSAHDLATGKWAIDHIAIDSNKNGIIDPNEIIVNTANTVAVCTFNADGTGTLTRHDTLEATLTWALTSDQAYFILTPQNGSPEYQHIDGLNATTMTLRDTAGAPLSWTVYKKQ